MIGKLVVLVTFAAACSSGNNRQKECEAARDRMIPVYEKNVTEGVAGADPAERDKLAAQGAREVSKFKQNFVGVCTSHPKLDLSCLRDGDEPDQVKRRACDDAWGPVFADIYK